MFFLRRKLDGQFDLASEFFHFVFPSDPFKFLDDVRCSQESFNPLQLTLPQYEGPLEALLDMIRKKKMSVHSVNLAEICSPFLEYVKAAREINLDLGAEFIAVSATLILIKSRSLLPKHEEEEDEDPSDEDSIVAKEEDLRRQLIELHRFERVSDFLGLRKLLDRDFFARAFPSEEDESLRTPPDGMPLFDLIEAYREVVKNRSYQKKIAVENETLSLGNQILELIERLSDSETLEWERFFSDFDKIRLILLFLAILELAHKGLLTVFQNEPFMSVHCRRSERFHQLKDGLTRLYAESPLMNQEY